ncbi:hypothetical protein MCOR02_003461 [Pyricularia oryzae]|nr:hypothetical protein MCOR02_003461 [Pyricularia oryzae]KAI6257385.1 hypothetical protein MCOR19_006181 [Pyricularia oryzae]KAI6335664.1 hypothetical protein MCOR30_003715 [Pyricularia oryzae]KAI6413176.1 hypothetical protein MCOR20_003034 [Pyricularia oryzae]KAI6423833.1 hypothetical protein MCOR24_003602 [Pyricularia oryzae]
MRFSNMFQLYAIAACSSHALALGTAEGQRGAAVVQRDSIGAGADGVQHQSLERRSPSPGLFGSRRGGRTRTKAAPAAPKEEFFDANDSFPRQKANARLAELQRANPQQTGSGAGRPSRADAASRLAALQQANPQQTGSGTTRPSRADAASRLAALQQANPQQADPTTGRPGGGTGAAQEDQFFDANDRTARQQASARLAQLQRANPQRADPQRPTLSRSGQIQKRPRRPRGRGLGLSQAV